MENTGSPNPGKPTTTQSKIDYKDYLVLRAKEAQKLKKSQMPLPLKIIFSTPFVILFFFGLIFLPFIIYQIVTSPRAVEKPDNPQSFLIDSKTK